MQPEPVPDVKVPSDPAMAFEPAATIAKLMQFKNAVAAILLIAGWAVSPALSNELDTLIQSGVTVGFMAWTFYSTWKQGQTTRAAVYAPATVAKYVEAAPPGPDVEIGDPANADVPTGIAGGVPDPRMPA